jgi:hypothetical protein
MDEQPINALEIVVKDGSETARTKKQITGTTWTSKPNQTEFCCSGGPQ